MAFFAQQGRTCTESLPITEIIAETEYWITVRGLRCRTPPSPGRACCAALAIASGSRNWKAWSELISTCLDERFAGGQRTRGAFLEDIAGLSRG